MPKKRDTPLFCFHFLFSCSSFPLVPLRSPHFLLGQSIQHRDPRLPREGSALRTAAAFAERLFLLPPLGLPDLSFHYASVVHTQPSPCLLSCHDIEQLPVLGASYAHGSSTLFLGTDTGHMARAGHSVLGSPYLWSLHRSSFMRPHVFSRCVPVMAAGHPETPRCPGPEYRQETESSKHPLPAHLGTSSR